MERSQDEGFMVGQDGGQPRDAQGRPEISLLKRQNESRRDICVKFFNFFYLMKFFQINLKYNEAQVTHSIHKNTYLTRSFPIFIHFY